MCAEAEEKMYRVVLSSLAGVNCKADQLDGTALQVQGQAVQAFCWSKR